jgi:hypothetical protein
LLSATSAGATQLFAPSARTDDVLQERPIVGAGYALRTVSVVERLQDPPSTTTHHFAVASKYDVVSAFKSLSQNGGLKVDDISIAGFRDANGSEISTTFGQIGPAELSALSNGDHDKPAGNDEAAFFTAGVRAMENTIEILRRIEGRVQAYQSAIDQCNDAVASINDSANSASARLTAIESELGQARHDVAFTRALLAEETARVDTINQRRDQIVAQHVKFLAFVRPRSNEALSGLPVRPLNPALAMSPIPACLASNIAAPPELRAMVNLLREAPLKWFVVIPPLLDKFDGLDVLHAAVVNSKLRAGFKLFQAPEPDPQTTAGPLGTQILNVFAARKQTVMNYRLAASQLDLTEFAGQTWQQSRVRAAELVSVGDLIDIGHYNPEIPRVSAAEIENILKVAACLYSDLSTVLPVIRLNWAERLTEIDSPVNLANLASLPHWAEVPYLDGKEMQAMVDWLFSRIVITESEAVAHINDLVQVCILLASHAPVADIIAGSVIRPTPIFVGGRVDLIADLSRVRVGMHVLMYSGNRTVARGVVENLASGQATARVLTATSDNISLDTNSKVHFAAPDAFERNPYTAGRLI